MNRFKLQRLNESVHNHIDSVIVLGQEKRDRTPGVHLSSLIEQEVDGRKQPYYCPRKLCLEQDYAPYELQTDPFLISTFRMGEKIHDMWQEWFFNAHASALEEIERRGHHPVYGLHFTMDALAHVPPVPSGQLYVTDFKGYNEQRCIEALQADVPPHDAHIQINMYLHLIRELYGMNDVLGLIILHNKNGRRLTPENIAPATLPRPDMYYKWYWTWVFEYDAAMAQPYVGRLNQLLKDYGRVKSEGRYPPRLPVCESVHSPRAKRCAVARVCFSNIFDREAYRIAGK